MWMRNFFDDGVRFEDIDDVEDMYDADMHAHKELIRHIRPAFNNFVKFGDRSVLDLLFNKRIRQYVEGILNNIFSEEERHTVNESFSFK